MAHGGEAWGGQLTVGPESDDEGGGICPSESAANAVWLFCQALWLIGCLALAVRDDTVEGLQMYARIMSSSRKVTIFALLTDALL
eukprot:CAMPEP_0174381310 /NCGR_PEP_ID=MMETSP0811_2-20130205/123928_1 /TAXON_ID=73025 ORGANISM="Eutreptiella gymnastica-like, Strain CCMP1594" /NCGR_SAMPLE_ID=MMETSP0811_2 /ASSEMBLY_ACC=CAM_ASM_000667 /LENGTH=84 /DNA_ID=CAMNT_0015534409 /DNA_START=2295 /DNA_END=2550 /DNA_ORIENTATION=+